MFTHCDGMDLFITTSLSLFSLFSRFFCHHPEKDWMRDNWVIGPQKTCSSLHIVSTLGIYGSKQERCMCIINHQKAGRKEHKGTKGRREKAGKRSRVFIPEQQH